jgi:hypothetical protein
VSCVRGRLGLHFLDLGLIPSSHADTLCTRNPAPLTVLRLHCGLVYFLVHPFELNGTRHKTITWNTKNTVIMFLNKQDCIFLDGLRFFVLPTR